MKKSWLVYTILTVGLTFLATQSSFASNNDSTKTKIDIKRQHTELKSKSLAEVQAEVPFSIIAPSDLPYGLVLKEVVVSHPPTGINNPKLARAILTFASPDKKNILQVWEGKATNTIKGKGIKNKKLAINNKGAEYVLTDKIAAISWSKGDVNFFAITNPNSDISSEETLVQIAKLFKQ
ncbi:hypothetical protein [Effusibacillus lacus]|uniref:DUF4367 domain-containing protein n=1 Tax=Effusibacillus lacus TaxID=1348429 RepID=A0A292YM42_9BACL|nr:hypothetical protein [Effusibacillus lacus]TCS70510.1 hypothetical protein EDD64_13241 [Effusibacillus lacus]GAX89540.1 hypothetical protein EFBL_1164 [Effusibacillus lacus]